MSKKYRIYLISFVIAVMIALVAMPLIAGGTAETEAEAPVETGELVVPFEGVSTVDEAVEAAMEIPGDWDYDPAERVIHGESAEISFPLQLNEDLWRDRLDLFEFHVLRESGTEYAFSNPMHENKEPGIYYSRATGQPLFSSEDKYDSGSGWPSFTRPINANAIVYIDDTKLFSPRIEVVDSLSGSHLGHVFNDGPAPTGQRYCINAAALIFVPEGEEPPAFIEELQALAAQTE